MTALDCGEWHVPPGADRGFFMLWTRRAVPPFYLSLAHRRVSDFEAQRGRPAALFALIDDVLPAALRNESHESPATLSRYRQACVAAGYTGVIFASELKLTVADLVADSHTLTLRDIKDVLPPYKSDVAALPLQEFAVLQFQHLLFRRCVSLLDASYVVYGRPWANFVRVCTRSLGRTLTEVVFDHQNEPAPNRRDRGFLIGGRDS